MAQLSDLERTVLREIARQAPERATALDPQTMETRLTARENTGAGFFTTFVVANERVTEGSKTRVGDVAATVEGLQHGMGFLLWLEDGLPRTLEGYSYDEDTTKIDFEHVAFSSVGPRV